MTMIEKVDEYIKQYEKIFGTHCRAMSLTVEQIYELAGELGMRELAYQLVAYQTSNIGAPTLTYRNVKIIIVD